MLGLSRHIVSGLIEAGFVTPARGRRNEWRFTFQDLALLRTAHALQSQSVPARRILRSLSRLKATLPEELPLSGLRITAVGGDVAVRDRNGRLQAGNGQLLLDFDVAPVAGTVAILEPAATASHEEDDAQALYEQALALAPNLEDAYLNLGAMLDASHRYADLLRLCDAGLQHCPDSPLLHFNRGVALDHLERVDEAATSYERSLELDPSLADAHFNLARLHQEAGDERGALRHYSAYRRLQR